MNDDQLVYTEDNPYQNIQSLMKELREKAYKAAGLLKDLKQQNKQLEERNKELEAALAALEKSLAEKTREFQQFQEEMKSTPALDVGDRLLYFSPDEREALERQINDLLARVSSHLR